MKIRNLQGIICLILFFLYANQALADELYNCIDQNGNAVLTGMPEDGMNCVKKEYLSPLEIADKKLQEKYKRVVDSYINSDEFKQKMQKVKEEQEVYDAKMSEYKSDEETKSATLKNEQNKYNQKRQFNPYKPTRSAMVQKEEEEVLQPYNTSSNRTGNTTFYSNGVTANQIGNTTFYSNGVTANQIGNTTFYSNGVTANQIGNSTFYSNGVTSNQIGDTTFYSNGKICNKVGNSVFCH